MSKTREIIFSLNATPKPPIGLRPRYIAEEKRLKEIKNAIARYWKANLTIPVEWIQEYNYYIERLPHERPKNITR